MRARPTSCGSYCPSVPEVGAEPADDHLDAALHYSAPELEELIVAVNKVCEEKSGKSPALVMLKQKTAGA